MTFLQKHRLLASEWAVLLAIGAIILAVFTSMTTAVMAALGAVGVFLAFARPLWVLGFLAAYFPLEPFLLKFIPDQLFVYTRFAPEVLLYSVALAALLSVFLRGNRPRTRLDVPFALFVVTLLASAVINFVPPTIAVLGARQILRFVIVFFAVVFLHPSRAYIRTITVMMLGLVLFESAIGLAQALFGEPVDAFLFPSESRYLSDLTLAPAAFRFWDPGSRIFATLGRYDRLGTFLEFFILIAVGVLYEVKTIRARKDLWLVFLLGLPALLLTYSRSGWFGFVLGFLLIGWVLKRDRRVRIATTIFVAIVSGYLLITGLVVNRLVDVPQQGLVERFFEAFSTARWEGEYYGLGRLFWIVNTPLHVVTAAPLFGWGPGQFGGGAVEALRNTRVYDRLGLPFGIAGTEGYVDNNWLSLWGETGTLGLLFYLWMFSTVFVISWRLWKQAADPFARALGLGMCGAVLAVALNAFLASFLEARTLAFYFWLYAGFVAVLSKKEGLDV